MKDHVELLLERRLPVPVVNTDPTITIHNQKREATTP
jgi:hypothetical protein